jgi:hypothetical protein
VTDGEVDAIDGDETNLVLAEAAAPDGEALHQIDCLQERLSHR